MIETREEKMQEVHDLVRQAVRRHRGEAHYISEHDGYILVHSSHEAPKILVHALQRTNPLESDGILIHELRRHLLVDQILCYGGGEYRVYQPLLLLLLLQERQLGSLGESVDNLFVDERVPASLLHDYADDEDRERHNVDHDEGRYDQPPDREGAKFGGHAVADKPVEVLVRVSHDVLAAKQPVCVEATDVDNNRNDHEVDEEESEDQLQGVQRSQPHEHDRQKRYGVQENYPHHPTYRLVLVHPERGGGNRFAQLAPREQHEGKVHRNGNVQHHLLARQRLVAVNEQASDEPQNEHGESADAEGEHGVVELGPDETILVAQDEKVELRRPGRKVREDRYHVPNEDLVPVCKSQVSKIFVLQVPVLEAENEIL
mmetsp:Transcript_3507/g.7907  ORF Transcript_3507/g.7907 Transcript_3507/m.7907 type:complete len:373 (+) Transcript_3507:1864-2982(+)